MKLNARIVARELARRHTIEVLGDAPTSLTLQRPELLERRCDRLEHNNLYVGRCEQLPQRATVGLGVTVVVDDMSARLRWFRDRCCVIVVRDASDVAGLFNEIQRVYLRYDLWEETLYNIVADDASIPALLEASSEVLEGTLDVVDARLHLLATTSEVGTDGARGCLMPMADKNGNLNPVGVTAFLDEHDPMMRVAEPFELDVSGISTLNVNLLSGDEYLGCLTLISGPGRPSDETDMPVLAFLASMVKRAMQRLDIESDETRGSIRESLRALVAGGSLDALSLSSLRAARGSYVCVKARPASGLSRLPLAYLRNVIETSMPDTVAFEHERSCVVAFVRLDDLAEEGERRRELSRRLERLTATIDIKAGVSDHLLGLESARTYFLQAGIALEIGDALDPGRTVYHFQDFALQELLLNALGELPVEAYYTPGMRRLFEHDATSPVSYVETLERLIANNMNVTRTARQLYLHRSTLIERLGHIRDAMGEELDDPWALLRVRIALAARELQARIRG